MKEEPANERALNYQAWAYFYKNDFQACIAVIDKAKQMSLQEYNFDHLLGRCYLKEEHFAKARTSFEAAIKQEPHRTDNYQLRAAALLLTNTANSSIKKIKDSYIFTEISSDYTNQMTTWVTDAKHKYYYPKLKEKYEKDFESLSYDEYFMFYFGFSQQDAYKPYSKSLDEQLRGFDKYFEVQDYEGCVKVGEAFLKAHPFVIEAYLYIGSAYHKMGNYAKYGEYMFKYHALLESINFTGTGKSTDSAFIVIDPSDEYDLLYYLGHNTAEQSLLHQNGHDYDVLQVKDEATSKVSYLYFNIDKPYQSLTNHFNQKNNIVEPNKDKRLNIKPGNK